jgi:hypothetical protein
MFQPGIAPAYFPGKATPKEAIIVFRGGLYTQCSGVTFSCSADLVMRLEFSFDMVPVWIQVAHGSALVGIGFHDGNRDSRCCFDWYRL